jgi:hypothetical protein
MAGNVALPRDDPVWPPSVLACRLLPLEILSLTSKKTRL